MNISKYGYNRNISKLITLIFRNMTIIQDILKWNRGQTKWDEGSRRFNFHKTKTFIRHHVINYEV